MILQFLKLFMKVDRVDPPPVVPGTWPPGGSMDPEHATRLHRIYESVSKNIERENALLNFRIIWSIVLSAGVVTTQSFVANYTKDHFPQQPSVQAVAQLGIMALSMLAAYFCYKSKEGVLAAQSQMEEVKQAYERYQAEFTSLGFPRPYGDKASHQAGNYNAIIFPAVLLVVWLGFLIAQCFRLCFQVRLLPPASTAARLMHWMLDR